MDQKGENSMKLAIAVLAVLLFLPAAHADSVPATFYDVTGTVVMPGLNGAMETLTFSFEVEVAANDGQPLQGETFPTLVPGTLDMSSTGPLITFDSETLIGSSGDHSLEFVNSVGDQIDIAWGFEYPYLPTGDVSWFYWCTNDAACADFGGPFDNGAGPFGSAEVNVALVPEAGMLVMLALGMLGISAYRKLSCQDGYFDAYEDDPINNDEGDMEPCRECRAEGGWTVCGQCNANKDRKSVV
jgi:hypothetical protein